MHTVIMTGDTYAIRDTLKNNGYRWDNASKAWVKTDSACATPAEVFAWLRTKMGGRGCGKLNVEVR